MPRHDLARVTDGIHIAHSFEFADAAALAAYAPIATDLYKLALVLDTKALYMLVLMSPVTWALVSDPTTGSVSSFNGRTGAVTPAADDYEVADITGLSTALSNKADLDGGGKIPTTQLPALAITNTFPVSSEVEMLALTAETGDVAVRSDLSKSFILRAEPASTLANWSELLSPAGGVASFNGRTGAVSPLAADYTPAFIGAEPAITPKNTAFNKNYSSSNPVMNGTASPGSSDDVARGNHVHPTDTSRAPTASPTFTGTPAAPTAAANTNTTQLATTAFVIGQAGTATPQALGTAAVGTSTRFAREDHAHSLSQAIAMALIF